MKITSIIIMTFFSLILVSACGDEVKAEIKLETIQCGMCVNTIEKNLKNLEGVVRVDVDLKKKVGVVTYNVTLVDLPAIENTISSLGYDANNTQADQKAYSKLDACCKIPGK